MKKTMGLGYRAPFYPDLIQGHTDIVWLEVISENYMWDKGLRWQNLEKLRTHYDLAFHGVSLSIASPEEHDEKYLRDLKRFVDFFQPVRVSDHLCWSSSGTHHWHDLLPFPYTQENLDRLTQKVLKFQEALKRPLVLENLSAYMRTPESEMSEYQFLAELCRRTDAQILLDVNNMIVNARNFGIDPYQELKKIDLSKVAQVHLAGFSEGRDFVIDTHSEPPHAATWDLWQSVCQIRADIPFMIEWDDDIPTFAEVKTHLDHAQELQVKNERMVYPI